MGVVQRNREKGLENSDRAEGASEVERVVRDGARRDTHAAGRTDSIRVFRISGGLLRMLTVLTVFSVFTVIGLGGGKRLGWMLGGGKACGVRLEAAPATGSGGRDAGRSGGHTVGIQVA